MNKRYNFLTQAQHTQKGSDQWRNYKKKRNLCTKLLRSAELSYWKDKFSNVKSNAEVCKVLAKSFQGTNKSYSIDPIKDLQGSLLTHDTLKANALNSYFTNIRSTLNNNTVPHLPPFTTISAELPQPFHLYLLIRNLYLTEQIVTLKKVRPVGQIT